jgi:hypothetical protein
MNNVFVCAGIIAISYLLLKFAEMRVKKEAKPLKEITRDAIIVYASVIVGMYIIEQMAPIAGSIGTGISGGSEMLHAFTDQPGF